MSFGRKFGRNASAKASVKIKQSKTKANNMFAIANKALRYGNACLDALNKPRRKQQITNCIEICANITATYVLMDWFKVTHAELEKIRKRTELIYENLIKTKDVKHPKPYEITYDTLIRDEIHAPDSTWNKSLDYPEYKRNVINLDDYATTYLDEGRILSYDDCIEATVRIFCLDLGQDVYNEGEIIWLCAAADVLGWRKYKAMFFVSMYRTMIRSKPQDVWDMYDTLIAKYGLRDSSREIVKNAEYYWKHSLQYVA